MAGASNAVRTQTLMQRLDVIDILGRGPVLDEFVELVRRFDLRDDPSKNQIAAAFYHDPDFDPRGNPVGHALTVCFGLDTTWTSFMADEVFARWQAAAQNLERLRVHAALDRPAFYGWAMFGVHIMSRTHTPQICFRNLRVAQAISHEDDRRFGHVWAEDLPPSLNGLLRVPGVGLRTAGAVEKALIDGLLATERIAPTTPQTGRSHHRRCSA